MGGGTGMGGLPAIIFQDDFENGSWSFFRSAGHGNGYVSYRPADAYSPTHVGNMYDASDAAPGYSVLGKAFQLSGAGHACWAGIRIKPLSNVGGELEVRDASSKELLSSTSFQLQTASSWIWVRTYPMSTTVSDAVLVRVVLLYNGAWQSLLLDDMYGGCDI
jgi:hypothetical protein